MEKPNFSKRAFQCAAFATLLYSFSWQTQNACSSDARPLCDPCSKHHHIGGYVLQRAALRFKDDTYCSLKSRIYFCRESQVSFCFSYLTCSLFATTCSLPTDETRGTQTTAWTSTWNDERSIPRRWFQVFVTVDRLNDRETRLSWEILVAENKLNTLSATPKSRVSLRTPREYFYYSKHIMAK